MNSIYLTFFLVCSATSALAVSNKSGDGNKAQGWGQHTPRHELGGSDQSGRKALEKLPDARELEELLAREAAQDPEDLFLLGLAYENDELWEPDYEKAFSYFQRSEDLGFPYAKSLLGYYYETGLAGEQDYGKAASYYQQGADFGDSWAGLRLGFLYLEGLGVRKTESQAFLDPVGEPGWFAGRDRRPRLALRGRDRNTGRRADGGKALSGRGRNRIAGRLGAARSSA
ncbi:tetratricopeptide repeat protein [Roseibium salinum]|uniref:tetratricopeptide repeat protein n=1 Tax=Roseibium salinum TaxID=1604349 RepID=UPI003610B698